MTDDFNTLGLKSEIITASVKTFLVLIFIVFQNKIGRILYR